MRVVRSSCTRLLQRRLSSRPAAAKRVAIRYGSFNCGHSIEDTEVIRDWVERRPDLELSLQVMSGDDFSFDELAELDHLVVSTSSVYGQAPGSISQFAHQLLLTAETAPGRLSHLQHAVWGNGDDRWFRTYMNAPRFIDHLLERAGSRRFYARGECGEPHAPTHSSDCQVKDWVPGMWAALASAGQPADPPVAWDALWADEPSPRHQDMTEWSLRELVERHGPLEGAPTALAKPGDAYHAMVTEVQAQVAARRARVEARRRRAEEERLNQPP